MVIHTIGLCSGVGMLEEAVRAALEFFGIDSKTVCYVEREAFAVSTLIKNMASGILDDAPIWSDITTFDGAAWRGKVDCVTAGFPCQPHSVAGKRKGTEDERWLWQDIARIIRDVSPRFVFLENVRGLLSSGGFTPVITSLVSLGFNIEWGVLSASAVGASHKRERVFILAYRDCLRKQQSQRVKREVRGRIGNSSKELADTNSKRFKADGFISGKAEGNTMPRVVHQDIMANAIGFGLRSRGNPNGENDRPVIGSDSQQLFAPSPESSGWQEIITDKPHLAPATEPDICFLDDGLAYMVDASRADQIRACGNGVVPLQAAAAFVALVQRAGI